MRRYPWRFGVQKISVLKKVKVDKAAKQCAELFASLSVKERSPGNKWIILK